LIHLYILLHGGFGHIAINVADVSQAVEVAKQLDVEVIRDAGPMNATLIHLYILLHGLPVGGELEYADINTIARALSARKDYH
jgi:hypothetical protein